MDLDINLLDSKLKALQDRPPGDTISRPVSQASTSSEALQYMSVNRNPITEEERIRLDAISKLYTDAIFGDEATRKAREEQEQQENRELKDFMCDHWGIPEAYMLEASRLTERRAREDHARDPSGVGYALVWTENDQQALEFQRQKEDYLQLKMELSILMAGDNLAENKKILRYRLRFLRKILGVYDSQRQETSKRLQEDMDRRKQPMQDFMHNGAKDHESEYQAGHNTTSKKGRGPSCSRQTKANRFTSKESFVCSGRVVKPTKSQHRSSQTPAIVRRSARVAAQVERAKEGAL